MDFSAKKFKQELIEKKQIKKAKIASANKVAKKAIEEVKAAREFIISIKIDVIKAALNKSTHCSLNNPTFDKKWWDNSKLTTAITDRGIEIIDFESESFGSWFSELYQLGNNDLIDLEKFLKKHFDSLSAIAKAKGHSQFKGIISDYTSNSVRYINVLRLLIVFHKLYLAFYCGEDHEEKGKSLEAIESAMDEVVEYISDLLPGHFDSLIEDLDLRREHFIISWRYPQDSKITDDGFNARNLRWLSSWDGNDAFLKLNDAIDKRVNECHSYLLIEFQREDNENIYITSDFLKGLKIEISAEHLSDILRALEFKVEINQLKNRDGANSSSLKIAWE